MLSCVKPTEIQPGGWFRRQLEIEAQGLIGNLDKIWPDVRDSAWIGGNRDGWERVPYWLDAFLPLAYFLDDADMKARAERYIHGILDRQHPDGWLCPCEEKDIPNYDLWALFLIGKVLALYISFTDDSAAEDALLRAMKDLYTRLSNGTCHLKDWGKYRWFEALVPIQFLHERHKEETWLLSLATLIRNEGADYSSFDEKWKTPLNIWTMETHIVNLCMMLKTEAVERALFGESRFDARAEEAILRRYNGTAVGTYTGDECLAGISNVQGTELCSVGELMYSCAWLYRVTKDTYWMEQLEDVAFNALPATFSDDMWTHQYLQMVNQIECQRFPNKPIFRTNGGESHLFGLEPNYGCCTANGGQGFPKLALSMFLKENNTILSPIMLPGTLHTMIGESHVGICLETDYPFRHTADYTVTVDRPTLFSLKIRIPAWAKEVRLNGQTVPVKKYLTIRKEWRNTETVHIELITAPRLVSRPHGMKVAKWGALAFALPRTAAWEKIEYTRDGVERKYPYCDYTLTSSAPWQFGFADDTLTVEERTGNAFPFSFDHPRIVLKARLSPIDWGFADGYLDVSAPIPHARTAIGESQEIELIPYGCAKLRVTEMPIITKKG